MEPTSTLAVAVVTTDHCTAEDIAARIDGTLSAPDRRAVEAHLASCSQCRGDLVAAQRLLSTKDIYVVRRRPRLPVWVFATAAGLAIAVVPLLRGPSVVDAPRPVVRSSSIEGRSLRALSPAAQTSLADDRRFVWTDAGDATYRVVITDSTGATVWTGNTRDTTIALPVGSRLTSGRRYFWSVDALKPDGSSFTSGSVPFSPRE